MRVYIWRRTNVRESPNFNLVASKKQHSPASEFTKYLHERIVRIVTFFSQGMLFTTSDCLKAPVDLVKLWLHEASRVYGDKLIEQKDMDTFQKLKFEVSKGAFEVCKLPQSTQQ